MLNISKQDDNRASFLRLFVYPFYGFLCLGGFRISIVRRSNPLDSNVIFPSAKWEELFDCSQLSLIITGTSALLSINLVCGNGVFRSSSCPRLGLSSHSVSRSLI
ncbi:hypothetical protein SAY87_011884 [Trapa incisa]|uniref:Uncharacterized protein n=1 Tax=Trapa incisa TaxID=236973 RepID=A0AAN7H046_9MYRT|nr:hypothetical protein SAY87_011884 [Trapa incisa]